MNFNVISLFPEMIDQALQFGLVGQAIGRGQVKLNLVNPRTFTHDVHHTVDDKPYGGGDGMIMQVGPLQAAMASLGSQVGHRVLLSAHGKKWQDSLARQWAAGGYPHITLVCGRYGGVDQRFINQYIDEEISIGDFILSGGELAALTIIDSVVRLLPQVLGNADSIHQESFADGLLEAPQFTRPQEILLSSLVSGMGGEASDGVARVPAVFLSGDHRRIQLAKRALSLLLTQLRRPDLMTQLHRLELKNYARVLREFSLEDFSACGVSQEDVRPYLEY